MSTNYYINTIDSYLVHDYFDNEYEIVEDPYLSYEIHLGKRSVGWEPLFASHKNAYKSVKEMLKFIKDHDHDFEIFDEYGKKLTLDELKKELVDWGKNDNPEIKYLKFDKLTHRMSAGTPDDYDLVKPIDHITYAKLENSGYVNSYTKDDEGYTFADYKFC